MAAHARIEWLFRYHFHDLGGRRTASLLEVTEGIARCQPAKCAERYPGTQRCRPSRPLTVVARGYVFESMMTRILPSASVSVD